MQKERAAKKIVIFDECWRLLENDAGSVISRGSFQNLPQIFCERVAISQNIDDFARSKVANAMLSNAAIKWICPKKVPIEADYRKSCI